MSGLLSHTGAARPRTPLKGWNRSGATSPSHNPIQTLAATPAKPALAKPVKARSPPRSRRLAKIGSPRTPQLRKRAGALAAGATPACGRAERFFLRLIPPRRASRGSDPSSAGVERK